MTNILPPTQREYWNGKVGDEWARQADLMDAMLAPLTAPAIDLLALNPGERVFDIGCGAGSTNAAWGGRCAASASNRCDACRTR